MGSRGAPAESPEGSHGATGCGVSDFPWVCPENHGFCGPCVV